MKDNVRRAVESPSTVVQNVRWQRIVLAAARHERTQPAHWQSTPTQLQPFLKGQECKQTQVCVCQYFPVTPGLSNTTFLSLLFGFETLTDVINKARQIVINNGFDPLSVDPAHGPLEDKIALLVG